MDFDDAPDEAVWRDECREWLAANVGRLDDAPRDPIRRAKAWQAIKFDAGLAKIGWDPEHGGCNGSPMQSIIFNQEEAEHRVPPNLFQIGLDFVAPTLRAHGTDAQRQRHLRPLLRGDEVWCQMFTEPNAGSDVAGLATSAIRDGDEWVINGQKVWTSQAHYADFGEVLCRTDPDMPKHQGITAFILDLKSPGVTVRPLRQMTGSADFNEIFLDDVRVPHTDVIGEPGEGWHVAVTTLMNERSSLGAGSGGSRDRTALRLADLARRRAAYGPIARQQIADIWIRSEIARYLGMRTLTAASHGRRPGPEGSVAKLAKTKLAVDVANVAMALLGPAGMAGADGDVRWVKRFLGAPGFRLGGGTDEVNRNVVAERVLGLPGEPRDDDTLPWREVPR
ncbi:MAG: acyl-CoA dehydrogenase family protein [Acidimicrobiales bacterium]